MRKALIILLALPSLTWADNTGATAAQFLKIGVGARATAMGGAYVAVADGAHAIYWNPAGAALAEQRELGTSFNNLYQDTNQGFIGYIHPTTKGTWGGAVDYLQVAGIEERTADSYNPNYTFTARDSAFLLSYAHPDVLLPHLSLGMNLKYIQSYIDTAHAQAAAVDGGALYKSPDCPLSLGLAVLNFGTGMTYVSATDPLPLGLKAGAAYELIKQRLLLAAGVDEWVHEQRTYEEFGLEWKPVPLVALRTGYQFGHSQDQLGNSWPGTSVGLGLCWKSLSLDYAYVPFGNLGNTQQFTLGIRFGEGSVSHEPERPILKSESTHNQPKEDLLSYFE